MPKIVPNTKEARLESWGDLVEAARRNEAKLPGTLSLVSSLAGTRSQVRMLIDRRESLLAAAQKLTQQLNQAVAEGEAVAIRLRSTIKGSLGIHTEELLHYGIKPIRKRSRAKR
jgi:phage terminase Nu1 subunit (DNA packaging protein)